MPRSSASNGGVSSLRPGPKPAGFAIDLGSVSAAGALATDSAAAAPPPTAPTPVPAPAPAPAIAPPAAPVSAALARVLEYMEKIRPRAAAGAGAEPPPSMREHITEAPTLLPTVIFQDLVFGAELGSGAFSTVRYCKHVQRGTAARLWPEYAARCSARS